MTSNKVGDVVSFEVYPECSTYGDDEIEIMYNYIDCPVCMENCTITDAQYDISEDVRYQNEPITCLNCRSSFLLLDNDPHYLRKIRFKIVNVEKRND